MSIGTITRSNQAGQKSSAPMFADLISFAGDDDYATGGTAGFEALVQAITGDQRKVIGVVPQDCGDNYPTYDRANDKLKTFVRSTGAEVANEADLSLVPFNLIVLSY